jgi:hypothetical protein
VRIPNGSSSGAHHRQDSPGDIQRAEQGGLDLGPEVPRGDLLEEPRVEVTRVVDQDVDPPESLAGSLDGGAGASRICDVEDGDQQVLVSAEHPADPLRVPAGGHDGVPGGQGRPCDVHAHAPAGRVERVCPEPAGARPAPQRGR